ncbi:MAG: ABC transporter substrate-binding protein [Candidatus Caldarchaeum sp.]|nr:ABC transporter substrate-binding protein [Candidatus Caldarchaeum sp.]
MVLNPAPAPAGELNPLTSQRIRFALNYVFNREFLVRDVFGGLALPMVTFLSSVDPDYTTIFDIIAKYDFKYDPALAASIIDEEMKKLGAEKVAGKWVYRGKPVTLKFIIRIEDERRQMGDSFAVELEKLGFTVERIYLPFGPAIQIIYGTDPKEF